MGKLRVLQPTPTQFGTGEEKEMTTMFFFSVEEKPSTEGRDQLER